MRTFASVVLTPESIQEISQRGTHEIVVSDNCSYITLNDETKAYYYSAILNYLAYTVIKMKGAFERDQFLRPLIAILRAGLEWNEEKWQVEIANLGKRLHQEAPKCLSSIIRRGMRVEECFKQLKRCDNTKELFNMLIEKLDKIMSEDKLEKALEIVCKLKK